MATGDLIITDERLGVGTTENLSTLTVRARASFTLTGTLTSTANSATVTGTSTLFLSQLAIGDRITVGGAWDATKAVVAIASDTSLTVDSPYLYGDTDSNVTAAPSAARFDDASGAAKSAFNDQGNLGVGTVGPNGQLEVSGPGAGDFFGCPVGIRVHNTENSDSWQLVMTTENDGKQPGVALWVSPFQDDGGATMTCSVYDGDQSIIDTLRVDAHGLHLQAGFSTLPLGIAANYTVAAGDHYVLADAGAGGITVTLPACGDSNGRMIAIIKSGGAGDVTVAPAGTDTINGAAGNKTISTAYSGIQFISVGNTWVATVMTAA